MTSLGIAVAQFAPGHDMHDNVAAIEGFVVTAASRGARLVIAPEYSSYFTAVMTAEWGMHAQHLSGAFVTEMARVASEHDVFIVAGMIEESHDPERFHNTLVAVSPTDGLVARYRKIHLYDAFGQRESEFVVAGAIMEPETFSVDGFIIGLQTCYDLRFPEVTRRLVDYGADVVAIPSEWVHGPLKEQHWRTLLAARAIENTIFVAAADHAPPIGVGNSVIVDPMGVEIARIGEHTDVAVAFLSATRIAEVRLMNPALELRRFAVIPKA